MRNIAIIYFTKYGQTSKVAAFLAQKFTNWEHGVQVIDAGRGGFRLREDVDTVIIGAPVFGGKFPRRLMRRIREHRRELAGKRLALFTVSLNAADERPGSRGADRALLRQWIDEAGLVPTHVASFAGALKYPRYSWWLRRLMRRISAEAGGGLDTAREYEYTDWHKVGLFAAAVENNFVDPHFSRSELFPDTALLDRWMPSFEHVWRTHIDVEASTGAIAEALRHVRLLGQTGNIPLVDLPGRETLTAVVGKTWPREEGGRSLTREEFERFREPGYSIVVSSLRLETRGVNQTRVHLELRARGTDRRTGARFSIFWALLGPEQHWMLRNSLRALKRRAEYDLTHSTAAPTGR